MIRRCLLGLFLAAAAMSPLPAEGQTQRDAAREQQIVAALESRAPLAVPPFRVATQAMDENKWQEASESFERVLAIIPDFDAALRRQGYVLAKLGRRADGLVLQERAVEVSRSASNLGSLAVTLLESHQSKTGVSSAASAQAARAATLAREAALLDPVDPDYGVLWAQAALQMNDAMGLREAAAFLLEHHSKRMPTHYFAAVSAAVSGDWSQAESEIGEAGRLGLPQEQVTSFLATGVSRRASVWRWAKGLGLLTGLWALGLLVLFVVGKVLSSRTLSEIENDTAEAEVPDGVRRLREVYRRLITVAGAYWYLSLPFVAIMVVALSAALIYGFLMLGQIPVKLTLLLVIGVLVTLYALVRSLFVRVRDESDPGRPILELDAPGLWNLAREVAREVGTRPVDEIWLTPHTEVAVFERGAFRLRKQDQARRALLIGVAILDGMDRTALRAVLAHEYGHFAHRDTAGGDVALRVRAGIYQFAEALARSGYAVWWNLAFQFLRLFDFIFRRISHGATRLQEVLADRVAIRRYGLAAFQEGLTHVIRRSAQFHSVANAEIGRAIEAERAIANLYTLACPSDAAEASEIEKQVEERLSAPTSEDDTHPSPQDRFRLGARIRSTAPAVDRGPVWALFADPDGLKLEMTARVAASVAAQTGLAHLAASGASS